MEGASAWPGDVLIMYARTMQWSREDVVHLRQVEHAEHIIARMRAVAWGCGRVAAALGFAGVMWLLLAGPGFLDGRSSTADRPAQHAAAQGAGVVGQASR